MFVHRRPRNVAWLLDSNQTGQIYIISTRKLLFLIRELMSREEFFTAIY